MIKINLLPWREELREERKKQFFLFLASALFLALIVMGGIHFYLVKSIEHQLARNARLTKEIKMLDAIIVEIKQLKMIKAALLARMSIIERLQADRSSMVRLFYDIAKMLPDGIYLKRVRRIGSMMTLYGYTESNTNVSDLMRHIERSNWLLEPRLNLIKSKKDRIHNSFELHFKLGQPSMRGMNQWN